MTLYLYIEQDQNNELHINTFASEDAAVGCAMARLQEAIKILLDEDYYIPPTDIDDDGFIEHYGEREEISSAPWGWHVFDGASESMRGYVEEIHIGIDTSDP